MDSFSKETGSGEHSWRKSPLKNNDSGTEGRILRTTKHTLVGLWVTTHLCVRQEKQLGPSELAAGRWTVHRTNEVHRVRSCRHKTTLFCHGHQQREAYCLLILSIEQCVCFLGTVPFTWLWIYSHSWPCCCQWTLCYCHWDRLPVRWNQRPTGRNTQSGRTSTGNSPGSSSESEQRGGYGTQSD